MQYKAKQRSTSQGRKGASRNASLSRARSSRTVLVRMAHDEARAERIRDLKANRPDLTWGRIADAVGVRERSALLWQQTGGIGYETAKKLADVFEVDADWLWSGRDGESPDLMAAIGNADGESQLDRIERRLEALEAKLDHHIAHTESYIDESRRDDARRDLIVETVSALDATGSAQELAEAFLGFARAEPAQPKPAQRSSRGRPRRTPARS